MDRGEYLAQLNTYGPFTLPKKESWMILGSGPSLDDVDFWALNKGIGIIALNGVLAGIPYSDVLMVSHYEDFLNTVSHFRRTQIVFVSNPLHTGYRCLPLDPFQLLDFDYLASHPEPEIRFFEKEMDLSKCLLRSHTLFTKHTIASTALHLLYLNGVKNVQTAGIDGGAGHAKRLKGLPSYDDVITGYQNAPKTLDYCFKEFCDTAKTFEITVSKYEKENSYASA